MNKIIVRCLILIVFGIHCADAHILNSESGWMHPLSGIDHMIAMIAVGAWSAQLGGKAIFRVPLAFVVAMLLGGIIGFSHIIMQFAEEGIAVSVLLLGLAIVFERRTSIILAVIGVGLFGICHGYAHGYEMPGMTNKYFYVIGFLITTACLHLLGAIGGLLMLENKHGSIYLRLCGVFASLVGIFLTLKLSIVVA